MSKIVEMFLKLLKEEMEKNESQSKQSHGTNNK